MAEFEYRCYVTFQLEGMCPPCEEDKALTLDGGLATSPMGYQIAIKSVVEAEPARWLKGEMRYCMDHQVEYDVDADGTPNEEGNDHDP